MDENDLAKEITTAMGIPKQPHLRAVEPRSNAVTNATNPDTERTTATMVEQMEKAIAIIERELGEANEVRMTVVRRVNNLTKALEVARTTLEALKT